MKMFIAILVLTATAASPAAANMCVQSRDILSTDSKDGKLMLAKALTAAGRTQSNSAGFNLISNGGVEVNGEIARDKFTQLDAGNEYLVRVGSKKRRFCRIRVLA